MLHVSIRTRGDGCCMYHALSLTLTGTQTITDLMRLLTAHALVKHKQSMLSAFLDAFGLQSVRYDPQKEFSDTLEQAVRIDQWGTDYNLFALSMLLDRPIFHYNTVYDTSLPSAGTVEQFTQCFQSRDECIVYTVPVPTCHCYLMVESAISHSYPFHFLIS